MMPSTGPKTSSWAMRMRLVTPVKIDGSTNRPRARALDLGRPAAERAARRLPGGDGDIVEHLLVLRPRGDRPDLVSTSGADRRACAVRANATSRSTNSSWIVSCTSRREPAMQVWPLAAKMPDTAPLTASSMTASSNTMLGDLPPSSSVTGFNWPAAA